MKISFEYYTNFAHIATEAFNIAADCNLDQLNLNKTHWGKLAYSISGEGDFDSLAPLMHFFKSNDFSEENDFE